MFLRDAGGRSRPVAGHDRRGTGESKGIHAGQALHGAARSRRFDDDNTREAAEVASFENRLAHVEASLKRNNM
jgi:hypothetical protein